MNNKNKTQYFYIILKSWWEIFPEEKVRCRRRVSLFRYDTYKEAHQAAIKIRKKDPYYRYDLGDRIYVRKYSK